MRSALARQAATALRAASAARCVAAAPLRVLHSARPILQAAAATPAATVSPLLSTPLSKLDPEIYDIIEKEKKRQWESLALIPSEVR
jgi:glycine hydroxymethyltransferase